MRNSALMGCMLQRAARIHHYYQYSYKKYKYWGWVHYKYWGGEGGISASTSTL